MLRRRGSGRLIKRIASVYLHGPLNEKLTIVSQNASTIFAERPSSLRWAYAPMSARMAQHNMWKIGVDICVA